MIVLLSLVSSLFVSSGKSGSTERTLVRLKSIVGVEVAVKVRFAGEDLVAAVSWTYVEHGEC